MLTTIQFIVLVLMSLVALYFSLAGKRFAVMSIVLVVSCYMAFNYGKWYEEYLQTPAQLPVDTVMVE